MIRLMGILLGSAIAIGALLLTLGLPELAPAPVETPASPEPAPQIEPAVALESLATPALKPDPAAESDEMAAEPSPVEPVADPVQPQVATTIEDTEKATERQWYAFWSPFRSEMAANGFMLQLQRTTGLDYRVVKLKPGVYEVAFAYSDDTDIQDKLAQISTATGLDLSGG